MIQQKKDLLHRSISFFMYMVFFVFTFLTIYPLFWLLMSSFKSTQAFQMDRLGFPDPFFFMNYPAAWRIGKFGTLFYNSVFY